MSVKLLQEKIGVTADGAFGPNTLRAAMAFYEMTPYRAAHFFGQTAHETNTYRAFSENLNYSASGLKKIFVRTTIDMSGVELTWRLYTRAASATTGGASSVIGTATAVAGPTDSSMVTYDFTSVSSNVINAGDKVQISVQADGSSADTIFFISCLWEWDFSGV